MDAAIQVGKHRQTDASLLDLLSGLASEPSRRRTPAMRHLEEHLALVGAWCQRAIAEAWESGRLSFAATEEKPFEREVQALLRRGECVGARVQAARAEVRALERAHDARLALHRTDLPATPLAALAHEHGLSRVATDILLLAAAPVIWGDMARLYAIVANDRERPMCDEWLIATLLGSERASRREIAAELEPHAPLVRVGLLRVDGAARPFASLRAHPLVVRRLYGDDFAQDGADGLVTPRDADRALADIHVAGGVGPFLRLVDRHSGRGCERLVLRGRPGSGRATLLAALAARSGRRLGMIDVPALASQPDAAEALRAALRSVLFRGWLPCLTGAERVAVEDPAAGERIREVVAGYPGSLLFRCAPDCLPPVHPGYLLFDLAPLSETERKNAWERALVGRGLPTDPAAALATAHPVTPGVIERVVEDASRASPAPAGDIVRSLEGSLCQHRKARIGDVATRITRMADWSRLVLPADAVEGIREFISRVRNRRIVFEGWGFDRIATTSRGLTALFQGAPGTGKSMVAGVIARELGYELYRVDLSRIVSKWVGETEQNLASLFDAAEDGPLVVLFDEADSLFARRTEVRSSNDRYANLAVNYLLQRLDTFQGIAILTTNLDASIDAAFKRRMSLRMTFLFPDEEMRERLWRAHLPAELPVVPPLALGDLARRFRLSGGHIRNVVVRAAFLAAHDQSPLSQEHLERAVRLEYREMGKLSEGGRLE